MATLLRQGWVGKTLKGCDIQPNGYKFLKNVSWPTLIEAMKAGPIKAVDTVGKNLWITLAAGKALHIHFASTGWLFPLEGQTIPLVEYFLHSISRESTKFTFLFDDGRKWEYRDPRTWGKLYLREGPYTTDTLLLRYGPDWLKFPEKAAQELIAARTQRRAKEVLTDQSIAAGVGNYLACESLFRAGVHPNRPWRSIPEAGRRLLCEAIQQVMQDSKDHDDHSYWKVFKRKGLPCPMCQAPIQYVKDGKSARGSYFCATCQV